MALLLPCGCSQGPECRCTDGSLVVTVPDSLVAQVTGVALSGNACDGVTPACTKGDAGACSAYAFHPVATGICHVEVALSGRTFATDVRIVQSMGCCPGLYPDTPGAGSIEVSSHPVGTT